MYNRKQAGPIIIQANFEKNHASNGGAIYNIDGELFATDDICTHAYARLSDGWLDRNEIECPLHAGRFDVKTGAATAPPCVDPVKTYPVRVEGDEIQVKLG